MRTDQGGPCGSHVGGLLMDKIGASYPRLGVDRRPVSGGVKRQIFTKLGFNPTAGGRQILKLRLLQAAVALCLSSISLFCYSNASERSDKKPAQIELLARNGSFTFDGVNDQTLNLKNSEILHVSPGAFTVTARVMFNSLTNASGPCFVNGEPSCDMSIVDKMLDTTGPNADGWRLLKQSDDHFWFCLGSSSNGCVNGSQTTVRSKTVVMTGVPYLVVGRKSINKGVIKIAIFVNGVLQDEKTVRFFTDTNSADLLIGGNLTERAFLNGEVDKVVIFGGAFAGTPGTANCHNQSVSALAQEYGGLNAAAAVLGYTGVSALQDDIEVFCGG